MTIAEKMVKEWWERCLEFAPYTAVDLNFVSQLITTVAERGIEEACKVTKYLEPYNFPSVGIRKNRWWEEEA